MRLKSVRILVVLIASAAFVGSALADEKKAPPAKAKAGGKIVMWSADEIKWIDPPNSPPGVKMAVLWGDPQKGPHGAFHKFVAGFEAPLHHHTANYRAAVISGTLIVTPEGGAAKKLPPGSYGSFSGMKKHTTKCDAGADCVIIVDASGPWDVVPDEAKK
jgi:anti-sigma factor ChrR (cupin superfamily)